MNKKTSSTPEEATQLTEIPAITQQVLCPLSPKLGTYGALRAMRVTPESFVLSDSDFDGVKKGEADVTSAASELCEHTC